MPDIPELSRGAAQQRNPEPEEAAEAPQAPQIIQARTAILVIQTLEGETVLSNNLNLPVTIEREASRDEAYGMLSTARKDMQVEESAMHTAASTIAQIEAKQRQAMEAMQNQQLQQHINQGGGIRGRG